MKRDGKPNDLLQRIGRHEFFNPILPELEALIDPATFTGRSSQIVKRVVDAKVKPALEQYRKALENVQDAEIKV